MQTSGSMLTAKIAFVTTYRSPYDDRIYYQLAESISKSREITIISGREDIQISGNINIIGFNGINLQKEAKIEKIRVILSGFKPDIVICFEPISVIAAYRYKKQAETNVKILYDITEWYPSKKNIADSKGFNALSLFCKLLALNIFASSKCNAFIFGEYYKSLPYRFIFPWKTWIFLGYYPNLKYINYKKANLKKNEIRIGFTGTVNSEKGIDFVFNSLLKLKAERPQLKVILKVVGSFAYPHDKEHFNTLIHKSKEITVEFINWQPFEKFSEAIQDVDIFADLRTTDFENQHCLPIKLFYYAACGRPVIYSNLKAIRKELNVSKFGYLVNPSDSNKIAEIILHYLDNPDLYYTQCDLAREMAVNKYNWGKIKPAYLSFIHTFENS